MEGHRPIRPWHLIAVSGAVLAQVIASAQLLPWVAEAFRFAARYPNNYPNDLIVILSATGAYLFQLAIWLWLFRQLIDRVRTTH